VKSTDQKILDRMVEIENESFEDGGLRKWELVPIIQHGKLIAMFDKGRPVGLLELMRDWDEPNNFYIYGVSVAKKYRNRGIGSKLLRYAFERFSDKGFKNAILTVDPENRPAVHLYKEKFGFVIDGYRKALYERNSDRFLMTLDIEEFSKNVEEVS